MDASKKALMPRSDIRRFCAKRCRGRQSINKASLEFHRRPTRLAEPMRIVDVCAFYTPAGGGVRTYVEAKLRAAARFGHEMIIIASGGRATR